MRDNEGNRIGAPEIFMNRCIHVKANSKHCEKGIEGRKLRTEDDLSPCFRNCTYAGGYCEHAEFMSREQAQAKYDNEVRKMHTMFGERKCPECGTQLIMAMPFVACPKHGVLIVV